MFETLDRQTQNLLTRAHTRGDVDVKQSLCYIIESMVHQGREILPDFYTSMVKTIDLDDGVFVFAMNSGSDLIARVNHRGEIVQIFDVFEHPVYQKLSVHDRIVHLKEAVLRYLHLYELERLLHRHASDSDELLAQEIRLCAQVNARQESVTFEPSTLHIFVKQV